MMLGNSTSAEQTDRKRQKVIHVTSTEQPQPDLNGLTSTDQTQTSWNHLLRYQELEDESIIDFGEEEDDQDESDTDDDGDEDSAPEDNLLKENERDGALGSTQAQRLLSTDEVVNIINERIEFYTESWPKHIEEDDYAVFSTEPAELWHKADASGLREGLARKHEANFLYFQHRLDELCEEITKHPGKSANSVRQQCRNFQITVASMEFSSHLAAIYQRVEAPINREIQASQQYQRSPTTDSVIPSSPRNVDLDMTAMGQALHLSSVGRHGDEPEHASISTVSRWDWMNLVATQDRKRVVSKLVNNMDSQVREALRLRLRLVDKATIFRETSNCIGVQTTDESHVEGVHPEGFAEITTLTKLFISWWYCENYVLQEPSRLDLEQLRLFLNQSSSDLNTFHSYLSTIMTTTFHEDALMHPFRPSQAEIIVISDDED